MKRLIRINESVLRNIVKRTVVNMLNETKGIENATPWREDKLRWFAEDIGAKHLTRNRFLDTNFGDISYHQESCLSLSLTFESPEDAKEFINVSNDFDGNYVVKPDVTNPNAVLVYCLEFGTPLKEEIGNNVYLVLDYDGYIAYGKVPYETARNYYMDCSYDRHGYAYIFKTEQEYNEFINNIQKQGETVKFGKPNPDGLVHGTDNLNTTIEESVRRTVKRYLNNLK